MTATKDPLTAETLDTIDESRISALKLASWLGLALTLLPSFLVFSGILTLDGFKTVVLAGSVLYLSTAALWINRDRGEES
jgi:hypothetical protein